MVAVILCVCGLVAWPCFVGVISCLRVFCFVVDVRDFCVCFVLCVLMCRLLALCVWLWFDVCLVCMLCWPLCSLSCWFCDCVVCNVCMFVCLFIS